MQVYTAGNQGESLANESIDAVKGAVDSLTPPPGVKVYVTGPAAMTADQQIASDRSLKVIEALTFAVIIVMMLLIYRSVVSVLLTLVMVVLGLAATRGAVAFLGYYDIIGLSTFATNLLVTLAIAAATDYAIFLIGRYQEARTRGFGPGSRLLRHVSRHRARDLGLGYDDCRRDVLPALHQTAVLPIARYPAGRRHGHPGVLRPDPRPGHHLGGDPIRKDVGAQAQCADPRLAQDRCVVVRWPGPILVATLALCLVGLVALPGYQTNYNDRNYLPGNLPAAEGYAAADRHFNQARMNPELLLIESDHDLRNSADFLVIDKIAKAVFRTPGIGRVQAITRPQGTPRSSTPRSRSRSACRAPRRK